MKKRKSKELKINKSKIANLLEIKGGLANAARSWEFSCFSDHGVTCGKES
ncbi:hypothetical protein [Kordia sp.]